MKTRFNKRGTIVYWVVFILIASVGLFIILNFRGLDEIPHIKGEWQYHFLEEYAYRAAKDQYVFEKKVLENSATTVDTISTTLPTQDQGCGLYQNIARWNSKDKTCFPPIVDQFITVAQQQLAQNVDPQIKVEKREQIIVATLDHHLTAPKVEYLPPARIKARPDSQKIDPNSPPFWDTITPKVIMDTPSAKKEYTTKLVSTIPLPAQLKELESLFPQAQQLLSACRNQEDLKSCLDKNRAERWQYGNCKNAEFTSQQRNVLFCYVFFNSDKGYPFALDFTSTKAFPLTLSKVIQTPAGYELHFPYDQEVLAFTIYYTNVDSLANYQGNPSDIIVLEQAGQTLERENFVNGPFIQSCEPPLLNTPHICQEELFYLITPAQPDTYYFAATQTKGKDESLINGFVGLTE